MVSYLCHFQAPPATTRERELHFQVIQLQQRYMQLSFWFDNLQIKFHIHLIFNSYVSNGILFEELQKQKMKNVQVCFNLDLSYLTIFWFRIVFLVLCSCFNLKKCKGPFELVPSFLFSIMCIFFPYYFLIDSCKLLLIAYARQILNWQFIYFNRYLLITMTFLSLWGH